MLFANSDSFIAFLLISVVFISFCCLISLAKTSSIVLTVMRMNIVLFSILEGKLLLFKWLIHFLELVEFMCVEWFIVFPYSFDVCRVYSDSSCFLQRIGNFCLLFLNFSFRLARCLHFFQRTGSWFHITSLFFFWFLFHWFLLFHFLHFAYFGFILLSLF